MTITSFPASAMSAYIGSGSVVRCWWPEEQPGIGEHRSPLAPEGIPGLTAPSWSAPLAAEEAPTTPGASGIASSAVAATGATIIHLREAGPEVRRTREQLSARRAAHLEALGSHLTQLEAGIRSITAVRQLTVGSVAVDAGLGTADFWRKVGALQAA